MKKASKKILAMVLALMMVLSLGATAFAAEDDVPEGVVRVVFTKDCTISYNTEEDPDATEYEWAIIGAPTADQIVYGPVDVTITDALLQNKNLYLNGHPDPLPGQVSYLDVIAEVAKVDTPSYGYDPDPVVGAPGFYISDFENLAHVTSLKKITDELYFIKGYGFVVAMGDAATNDITFPTEYLSNIPAKGGITLYVDCGYYELYTQM